MKKNNLGCCGLNCEECPVFIATANNDDKLRQKTAEEWSKLYAEYLEKDLTLKDMNCKGCWSESSVFIGCSNCPIRKCCKGKGFSTCASCDEYETCNMLKGFFSVPNHQNAESNLDKIRGNQ
ncbi:DUF3795 domain-containing protein [Methanococcoides sp. SA1]|nr:DUF3795 domain-containing protein [Methanococcoides sp. SA1]